MTSKSDELLRGLLSVMLKEWSPVRVYRTLDSLVPEQERPRANAKRRADRPQQRTPTDQVKMLKLPRDKKRVLLEMAIDFENKKYLPTISDARNHLEMLGLDGGAIKSRTESFKALLPILVDMPPEALERTRRRGGQGGPARLGPLADAIRESGAAAAVRERRAEFVGDRDSPPSGKLGADSK
ncbi:MAG: hypothetical protein ACJ8ER_13760 [Allosphingosinicella sp.]